MALQAGISSVEMTPKDFSVYGPIRLATRPLLQFSFWMANLIITYHSLFPSPQSHPRAQAPQAHRNPLHHDILPASRGPRRVHGAALRPRWRGLKPQPVPAGGDYEPPCTFPVGGVLLRVQSRTQPRPPFASHRTLTANIRRRRGSKVAINLPLFIDERTPRPFVDRTIPWQRNIYPEDPG